MMSLADPVDNSTQGLHDLMLDALFDNSIQGLHNLTILLRDHPEVVNTCITCPTFPVPGGPVYFSTPQPPIFWALSVCDYDFEWTTSRVSILVNHGAELNVLHRSGRSRPLDDLLTCISWSEIDPSHLITLAWFMIHWGADPNYRADVCTTLCDIILGISAYNTAEYIESLLELGFNHNAVGRNGWTALMIAINMTHDDTVEVLLRHGADPLMPAEPRTAVPDDRVAWNNVTAIELACAIGSLRCVELCFDYDYRIRRRIRLRGEFLSVACSARQVDVIFFLVKKIMIPL